jgi:hypothetical protein
MTETYGIAVFRELIDSLVSRVHPTGITVARMHLEEAIKADARGDDSEMYRRLSIIDTRLEAEQDWLAEIIVNHVKDVE